MSTTGTASRRRVTLVAIASVLLVGSGAVVVTPRPSRAHTAPAVRLGATDRREPGAAEIPAPLTPVSLDLRAGPVDIPLRLHMPTIGVDAAMLGVGILPDDTMDAPVGARDQPVWDQAFWYRGSAIPGAVSTALIAGHIDGPSGRAASFGHLDQLRPGDPIIVRDTRTGLDLRFTVTDSETYPLERTHERAILTRIYGAGPVAGTWPQPSVDGLAHLTLMTCAGTFRNGTHDHRLAVYAVRTA